MFKFAAIIVAVVCVISAANAGLVTTHHVVHEPVLAKVGHVVHSAPSLVSHRSITQVHSKTDVVEPIFAPVVRTTIHTAPVVHAPVVHAYHAAPVIHTVPVLHAIHH